MCIFKLLNTQVSPVRLITVLIYCAVFVEAFTHAEMIAHTKTNLVMQKLVNNALRQMQEIHTQSLSLSFL